MTTDPGVLLSYYDACLDAAGDTARGAGWPDEADRIRRFDVMLDLIRMAGEERDHADLRLCDVACGTGELRRRMVERGMGAIDYLGIDASVKAIELAKGKFPGTAFLVGDVRHIDELIEMDSDYMVVDGLFTVRRAMTETAMWSFMLDTLHRLWPRTRRGLAFNVMSAVVDWRRDDLFHVGMDELCATLFPLAGRRIVLRSDYGLYEYTAYLLR